MRISDWSSDVCSSDLWLGMVNPVRSQERLRDDDPEIQNRIALFRELVSWQKSRESFGKSSCWTFHDLRSAVSGPTEGDFSALSDAIAAGVFKGIDGMRSEENTSELQ